MDRRNGLPLALVHRGKSAATAPTQNDVQSHCSFCGGATVGRATSTTYCCDKAELLELRKVTREIGQRLAVELEDPPADQHMLLFLSWLRQRVQRSQRV